MLEKEPYMPKAKETEAHAQEAKVHASKEAQMNLHAPKAIEKGGQLKASEPKDWPNVTQGGKATELEG